MATLNLAAAVDAKSAAAAAAAPAKVSAPVSARGVGSTRDEPPKTSAEDDIAFCKSVIEATNTAAVTRAVASLKYYVEHSAVVVVALQALAGLALDNPKKQTIIQQKGGITALIGAMKRYPTDLRVQEEACNTLIAICDQHDANANAVSKPAIPLLMEQLSKFTTADGAGAGAGAGTEVVGVAIHAMDIVCAAASGRKEAALKGVAQLTMEVMKVHRKSARIQERGSGVLRHIASDAAGKEIIKSMGGIPFLQGLKVRCVVCVCDR